jgi:peptidoglycan/LPS O-acetylase OafA/YrhL
MTVGLGTWRFLLAALVAISHLWEDMIHGPAAYAVWGFFILSGYLMTYVLSFKYGTSKTGLRDYAFNRFLRIYPAYVVALAAGAITIYTLPRMGIQPSVLNPQFIRPHTLLEWLTNLFLLPISTPGLFVPVAGALAVEVGAYALMPLMANKKSAAWLGFILSTALNVKYGFGLDSFGERYSSFLTCFMAFSAGALLCQYNDALESLRAPRLSIVVWCVHCSVWLWLPYWPWTYGLYVSLLLSAWVVLSLAPIEQNWLDQRLGDLSYPVYLFHTTAAIWLVAAGMQIRSFDFFLVSFIITVGVSWIVLKFVDLPLAGLKRKRVLRKGKHE